MRIYELMLVVKPDLDDAGVAGVVAAVTDAVERGSGTVIGSGQLADKKGTIVPVPGEGWRTRRLAYTIDGYRDGYYVVVHFESEPGFVDQLERTLNIRDDVMRHLVIRVEDGTMPVYAEPAAVPDVAPDEPLLSAPDDDEDEADDDDTVDVDLVVPSPVAAAAVPETEGGDDDSGEDEADDGEADVDDGDDGADDSVDDEDDEDDTDDDDEDDDREQA